MNKTEHFSNGRTTAEVTRIANIVHRTQKTNSQFTQALLLHLEKVQFEASPRFLGVDEKNREMLSYIEGKVPRNLGVWADDVLIAAAKIIKKYHDATMNFSEHEEIVCHHDLSPCNTVFKNGMPIALIDFDAAAPGKRSEDLAYAIWLWCDLGNQLFSPLDQARRLQLFCHTYGMQDVALVIDAIISIQKKQISQYQTQVNQGQVEWESAIKWAKNCLTWVIENQKNLNPPLSELANVAIYRYLTATDIASLSKAFCEINWIKPIALFEQYLKEVEAGQRLVWVALYQNRFAGYITLKRQSSYASFREKNIPEIMDLNVLPAFRKMGIGSTLLELAETAATMQNDIVGVGVGLYAGDDGGYGPAQKLYVKRGYIPDGKGVTYDYKSVKPGNSYTLDDALILWLQKNLH